MSRKIAVRMDDITPDMNWENFRFFQELFEKTGITPLLGIVPECRDEKLHCGERRENFYEVMRELQAKGYSFAIHGCYHLYTTKKGGLFPLNNISEFAGIPYEKQKEMLAFGKTKLKEQGIDTNLFMAPAHSYDNNTLRALREIGINKVTDGFGKNPYTYKGLTFYPISFLLSRSLRQKDGVTTLVLHANTVTEADKKRYQRIFDEYGKNMISYSEYLEMKPVKRNFPGRIGEYLLAKGKFLAGRIRR
ncbi:MAG: DUF2334 domain-containing protein [Lachnospiraceae bacterium]|nr:DUF2334 domain-containing protein [Lachnospiraceae bacterium]